MDSKFMLLTTKPPHGTQTECSHMLELISLDYQFFSNILVSKVHPTHIRMKTPEPFVLKCHRMKSRKYQFPGYWEFPPL